MLTRKEFIRRMSLLGLLPLASLQSCDRKEKKLVTEKNENNTINPIVISTWDAGMRANIPAWEIIKNNGWSLDAVEKGVMVTEAEINCCVGLGGRPDRDGFVTLDACIMDDKHRCGSVAMLQHIKHPISVARKVMETTPHVMLVGEGAYKFAIENGFIDEWTGLNPESKKEYEKWLKSNEYKPRINVESSKNNHDTIGMLALDKKGRLSGSCTTSGMAFKMHGRVGDSPIIGAGLFVDNEIGAACATGTGEEVIRVGGSHLVVERMRIGATPQEACEEAINRIIKKSPHNIEEHQVAFIAIDKFGHYGTYCIQPGFEAAIHTEQGSHLLKAKSYFS
jgi:N4-(beta-N-acetylglucosaminyl)-L-asparaginase